MSDSYDAEARERARARARERLANRGFDGSAGASGMDRSADSDAQARAEYAARVRQARASQQASGGDVRRGRRVSDDSQRSQGQRSQQRQAAGGQRAQGQRVRSDQAEQMQRQRAQGQRAQRSREGQAVRGDRAPVRSSAPRTSDRERALARQRAAADGNRGYSGGGNLSYSGGPGNGNGNGNGRGRGKGGSIIKIAIVVVLLVAIFFSVKAAMAFMAGNDNGGNAGNNASNVVNNASNNASSNQASNQANNQGGGGVAPSDEAKARIALGLYGDADTIVLKGESYIEAGAWAADRNKENISTSITISGNVDTSKVGDYAVTYTAATSDGVKLSKTRTVHVVDSMDKASQVPVLMYHYVYSADDPPESIDNNYILDTDLAEHLQYLNDNDYYYPSMDELAAFVKGTHSLPAKSVVLTFDDGEWGFLNTGIPVLEKYQVPATSFLVCFDNTAPITMFASEYVSYQSHSYNMHRAGGDVGHGGVVSALTKDEILEDLNHAIQLLGSSKAYAYPFGDTTPDAQQAITEAGILCAFTTDYDYVHPGDDATVLSRIRVLGSAGLDSFVSSLG